VPNKPAGSASPPALAYHLPKKENDAGDLLSCLDPKKNTPKPCFFFPLSVRNGLELKREWLPRDRNQNNRKKLQIGNTRRCGRVSPPAARESPGVPVTGNLG